MPILKKRGLLTGLAFAGLLCPTSGQADCREKMEYIIGVGRDIDRAQSEYKLNVGGPPGGDLSCLNEKYIRFLREKAAYLRECYAQNGQTQSQAEDEALAAENSANQYSIMIHDCR